MAELTTDEITLGDQPEIQEEIQENENLTELQENKDSLTFGDDDDTNDYLTEKDEEEEDLYIDEILSPLEKLIKFSKTGLAIQRLVVTKELFTTIQQVSLQEAVDTILPIIIQLTKDNDDSIRETLATELENIMYFYYVNVPPILADTNQQDTALHIPKHLFTATIIEFLLDQNTTLASIAQQSIVNVALRLSETPKDSPQYSLSRAVLNQEIFQGIVPSLMAIYNEEQQEVDDNLTKILKNYDTGGANLAKMVCLMLISALAPAFESKECEEKILPIVESLVTDTMFYVRKEVAAAIGNLSTVLTPDLTLERLLPIYLKLSVDTIWHVRRSCVFSLPLLCQALDDEMKTKVAVESVELFKNDVSRNVRNSLADMTGELISKFLPDDWKETRQPGQVPLELLEYFLSLGIINKSQKIDMDRIHNCAYNFPAVVLTAGVDYWDSHLKDSYLILTKDYQIKVRQTFACSLHEIARTIGPDRTERDLVQIFALYLMDLDDVKQGVLEHLAEFLGVLDPESRNEYIPILAELWDGVVNSWHLRNILTLQLKDIAKLFDASRVVEHILPLTLRACQDEFAAVRESSVEILPVILDIVKHAQDTDDMLLNHVMEKLDELVKSPMYRTRLVFVQLCRSLLEAGIRPADFASFFLSRLDLLTQDTIINIRIATSRVVALLCLTDGFRKELESSMESSLVLEDIFYHLSTDSDQDVQYYVHNFIDVEKLEMYKKRQVDDLEITTQQDTASPMDVQITDTVNNQVNISDTTNQVLLNTVATLE